MKTSFSGMEVETFVHSSYSNCNCSNMYPFDNVLTLYISNSGKPRLIWVESKHQNIIVSDINGCKCSVMFSVNSSFYITTLAVDKHNIYWTTNESMCSRSIQELNDLPIVQNDSSLYCLKNVTAVYTIDGLTESSRFK